MVMLEALQKFYYDKKVRQIGEVFPSVHDSDTVLLVRLNKVKTVTEKPKQTYVTNDLKAEEASPVPQQEEQRKRRVYKRRDMVPEE